MPRRTLHRPESIDLSLSLRWSSIRAAAFVSGPPAAMNRRTGEYWWSARSPDGPVTMRFEASAATVAVEAWGAGAAWGLDAAPGLLGFEDDVSTFDPPPGLVAELHRRQLGLRLGRTGLVFQAMIPTILGQKVTGIEAERSFAGIVRTYGEPAPGPVDAMVAPSATTIASLTYADFHPHGVERKRAVVLLEAARRAKRLEEISTMTSQDAFDRLTAIRGIGAWSAALVMGSALGDPDAVPVGDYHIPNTVSFALAGEPRGTDERMLELLEPYQGHRRRVITLIKGAGISAPKYGPKLAPRSFSRH